MAHRLMIPVNDFDPRRISSVLLMGTSTARMVGSAIVAGAGSAVGCYGWNEGAAEAGRARLPSHDRRSPGLAGVFLIRTLFLSEKEAASIGTWAFVVGCVQGDDCGTATRNNICRPLWGLVWLGGEIALQRRLGKPAQTGLGS